MKEGEGGSDRRRRHVIMMVIASTCQRRSVLPRPALATHQLKDVINVEIQTNTSSIHSVTAVYHL